MPCLRTILKQPRTILAIVWCAAVLPATGQQKKDTTFLYKNKDHVIFIETAKHSVFYDEISRFDFDEMDQQGYAYSLEYFKTNGIALSRNAIKGVPAKWIALQYYKDKFYTYRPSDFLFHYQSSITDTAYIDYTGEGPIANKIVSYAQPDHKTLRMKLAGVNEPDRTLTIHIIDLSNGVAVFEESVAGLGTRYYLMIAADKIRNFPVIVSYCTNRKQSEFRFKEPDYSQLLKNSR